MNMETILTFKKDELEQLKGIHTAQEIHQQPDLWAETIDIIQSNRIKIDNFIDNVLAKKGLRIILTGAGTSAFVGDSIAPYIQKKYPTVFVEAIATTDIVANPENYLFKDAPTLLISFARSGNSPESVATVELAEQIVTDLSQINITCNPEGKLAQRSLNEDKMLTLLMPSGANDQGFAMTGSFTCMSLAALLSFEKQEFDRVAKEVTRLIELSRSVIKQDVHIKELAALTNEKIVFLGSSCLKGAAEEAELKTLELTSGKLETMHESPLGFRHGPKSILDRNTVIFYYLSSNSHTRQYEIDLLKEVEAQKEYKKIIAFSAYQDTEVDELVDHCFTLENQNQLNLDDVYLLFPYILFAQMYAFFKSIHLTITPDNPSSSGHVNRVVKGVNIYPYNA
jgi:tagatose-6-phosphate ketose/aldose isomerase